MSSQSDYPIDMIAPVSPIRRIERKGRKKESLFGGWREIFMEKLAGAGAQGVLSVEEAPIETSVTDSAVTEQPAVILRSRDGRSIVIETEEDFRRIILMIQKLGDDPVRLFESHLNLFIEPAPPGKVLNSAG